MAILSATPRARVSKVQWLHWLFVQDDRAISCSLDIRGDGTHVVTLVPLWSPDDQVTETFLGASDAVQWQELMTQRLQASGWLLVEGRVVTAAA
jgi:hypothetical protein